MDRQQALEAYILALTPEVEQELYRQALRRSRAVTRGMTEKEREDYLKSKAFSGALFRLRRSDGVYRGLQNNELILESHQAEFDRLAPLIITELKRGRKVELPFLRSVVACRVTLKQAHAALELAERGGLRRALEAEAKRLAGRTESRVERFLRRGDLTGFVPARGQAEEVFASGVTVQAVDQALLPETLTGMLREGLRKACPELIGCGGIRTSSGETVSERIDSQVRRVKKAVCANLNRKFPSRRLRALLSENPSLKKMQKQADAVRDRERRLRAALVTAIPEHYRDLYPLARSMRRRFILHLGPTNSGKTHESTGRLRGARHGIYLGPLRLLAAEQFEEMNLNDVPCSLVTGEEQILVPGSRVQASTVEMADLKARYDVAVIDECQMIADRDRGGAWTAAILGLCADEIHLCASQDAEELLERIIGECGDDYSVVRHMRMTPLEVEKQGFRFPASVRRGDALIVFSKARVHAAAAELKRQGWRVSLIYGALPPDVRRDQAERFRRGDSEVVVSTDAIAMGMNLPIERVVFLESEKYDGDIVRPLSDAEIKQIAGRAGRYGQYETGYVNAFGFRGTVARALNKPLMKLTEAVIGFPESLLGIDLPLTQILDRWLAMKDKGCFSKASTARMAALAHMMETPHTDKALLYRFLCIPFDETEQDLLARWRAMYHAECAGGHVDVLPEIPHYPDPEECTIDGLDTLEADYRRCDLYYNYARLFLPEPEDLMEEIQRRKSLISEGIIHILSTQRLRQRTCPECGRVLPWNWPYRLCDPCHRRQRGGRSAGGYDG